MSEKLRGVIVGCGGMSHTWVRVAREIPDFELVGFVDIDLGAAKTRAADYNESNPSEISTDLSRTLKNTGPDVVFDCSIPETHAEVTLEALGNGCHVLGEKPLADSMESARRVVAAAEEAGKEYAVMQNRRFDANIRRLRGTIESGEIGSITTLNSDFYKGVHFGGFRDIMRHVLLLDMAIHTFDAARLILGVGLLQRVESPRFLVQAGRFGGGHLRNGQWHRLHLPRQLVLGRAGDNLGMRLACDR